MIEWNIAGHKCTAHAQKRMQQRGIKKETIEAVLLHGDKRRHLGGDTLSIFISKKRSNHLSQSGILKTSIIEKAANIIVLTAEEMIVTAMPRRGGRSWRYQQAALQN